jgi:Phosphomevalonate kinase
MKIIATSGLARSGKDTIADCLEVEIKSAFPNLRIKRESLASSLKEEMAEFLMDKFGVNIYTMDGEKKERFRPLLVAYGFAKRLQTKGTYFTSLLQQKMERENYDICIISDLRYAENEGDELFWLKNQGGKLIHIRRFNVKNGKREYIKPPNSDEKKNDPILEKNADFKIVWESSHSQEELKRESVKFCQSFIHENIKLFL